jgi:putative membrane protein
MWHHYGPGWGPGWWVIGGFLWLAFWVAVVVLIVALVRGRHRHPHGEEGIGSSDAVRVLEDRYARGEISREEFLERRSVLKGGAPPPPSNPPPDIPTDPTPTEQL